MKEQLQTDIKTYFKDKWESIASDQLLQVLELRPDNAFGFLFQKNILKQKQESSATSLLVDVSLYCVYCDPLLVNLKTFEDRLLSICIQKHGQTRLKKADFKRLLDILCLELEATEKDNLIEAILTHQSDRIPISKLSHGLYQAVIYCRAVNQLKILVDSLEEANQQLTGTLLNSYLKSQPNSYIGNFPCKLGAQRIRPQSLLQGFVESIKKSMF